MKKFKYIIGVILGLIITFNSTGQKITVDNLKVNNKMAFKLVTPVPQNPSPYFLQKVGDLYLNGLDSNFYYYLNPSMGYLRLITSRDLSGLSLVETDPYFRASSAFGITSNLINNWNTAYGWGNHRSMGYITGLNLNQLGDVSISTPSSGQILTWNGSRWANATLPIYTGGTVTSVSLSLPSIFNVTGNPVTTTGTLTGSLANQSANLVFSSPNGSSGTPTFRSLVANDIPNITALNGYVSGYNFYQNQITGVSSSLSGLLKSTSGTLSTVTDNSTNWNTAYGWGNHASAGYVPSSMFSIITPSNNQLLKYNSITYKWENWTPNYLTTSDVQTTAFDIGGDHYVAPWGDDGGSGTFDDPWATWYYAANQTVAGDTIYFRGGIYTISGNEDGIYVTNRDGTSSNPICMWAYPGETPILDCYGITYSSGSNYGVYIRDCAYWNVKGLHVRGQQGTAVYYGYGFYLRGNTNSTFEQLVAYNCEGPGINLGWPGSDNNYLINCDAYGNFDVAQNGENANGIEVNGTDPATTHHVISCRAWNNSDDGIEVWDSDGLVYVDNCWTFNNGRGTAGDGDGLKIGTAANTDENVRRILTNNLVVNNRQNGISRNSANVTVEMYNNIVYGNLDEGIWMSQYAHADIARNNIAYNNGGDYEQSFAVSTIHDHNDWDTDANVTDDDFVSLDSMQLYRERKSNGDLPDITFLRIKHNSDILSSGVFGTETNVVQKTIMEHGFTIPGVVGDGVTNDAAALQTYINAQGIGAEVNIPFGTYRINSTLSILNQQKVNFNNSLIKADINNGTAAIKVTGGYNTWRVDNVMIFSYGNTWRNFIGLQIGDGIPGTSAYYGEATNIIVYWAHKGVEWNGYTIKMRDIQTRYCGVGIHGTSLNNVTLDNPVLEMDTVEFNFEGGADMVVKNLLLQGDMDWRPSRIDGMTNLTIETIYNENNTGDIDSSLIIVGGKSECKNITIRNGSFYTVNMSPNPMLFLDNVNGIILEAITCTNTYVPIFATTSRTTGLQIRSIYTYPNSAAKIQDNNRLLGPKYNYFPNSSFEVFLRGYSNIYRTSIDDISQETDTVKSGNSALRILSGGTYGQVQFYLNNDINELKGRKVTLGAWIYVPPISGYQNAYGSRTIFPNIILNSNNGATTRSTPTSPSNYLMSGYWNFFSDTLTIQPNATSVYLQVYVNQSGTSSTTNFIIIDDVQIVNGVVSPAELSSTRFPDAEDLSAIIRNKKMILSADAVPTDVDQTYADGDQVWKITTVANESPGWICTTGGIGGTAVWTPMSNPQQIGDSIANMKAGIFHVLDYGAIDGADQVPIQAAVDAANAYGEGFGGGTVIIPAGNYNLTSHVTLKPYVTIQIDKNAVFYVPSNYTGSVWHHDDGSLHYSHVSGGIYEETAPRKYRWNCVDFNLSGTGDKILFCSFNNMVIRHAQKAFKGIMASGAWVNGNTFKDNTAFDCVDGLYMKAPRASNNYFDGNTIENFVIQAEDSTRYGIDSLTGWGNKISIMAWDLSRTNNRIIYLATSAEKNDITIGGDNTGTYTFGGYDNTIRSTAQGKEIIQNPLYLGYEGYSEDVNQLLMYRDGIHGSSSPGGDFAIYMNSALHPQNSITANSAARIVTQNYASSNYGSTLVFQIHGTADASSTYLEAMRFAPTRVTINLSLVPTYADNTAAVAGGLTDGMLYKTSAGVLMITDAP